MKYSLIQNRMRFHNLSIVAYCIGPFANTQKSLSGNVVVVGRQRDNSGGHTYLLYDYSYNPDIGAHQFYLYDPWMYAQSTTLFRTYAWICDGQDAYYADQKDRLVWSWFVVL